MANTLTAIMGKIIANGLLVLRSKAIMARVVNLNWSDETARFGQTIDVPIPTAYDDVDDVTPAPVPPTPKNTAINTVQIALTSWKKTDFFLTEKEMGEIDSRKHFLPMQALQAIEALARKINTDVFSQYLGIYGYAGTAGTTPFASDVTAATGVRKVLNQQLCPPDARRCVLDPNAEANALALAQFSDADKVGSADVKIEGEIGRKFGMDFYYDTQVPTHTTGTLSDGSAHQALFNGGGSPQTVGATTMNIDATTLTGTVVKGDIFTVAGDSQTYVVTSGPHTAASNAITGISFSPAAKVAWADNAQVVFKATHVVNLAFHRDAFALAIRPPMNNPELDSLLVAPPRTITDPVTGLSLTLNIMHEYHQWAWEFSVLYGFKLVRPEMAARLAG